MKLTRTEFEKLTLEQLDMLYRIARRLVRQDGAAEDLVQETCVRALRSWETFDLQEYGIRPWLVRILHNVHFSAARKIQTQGQTVGAEHLDEMPGGEAALPLTPGTFEAMDQRLVRALNQLPAEYQTVMLLWAVEEFTYKEIAEALEVPIGTVMSRLYRAKQKLAEQLDSLGKERRIVRE